MIEILQKLMRRDCIDPFTQGVDAASACLRFLIAHMSGQPIPMNFSNGFVDSTWFDAGKLTMH